MFGTIAKAYNQMQLSVVQTTTIVMIVITATHKIVISLESFNFSSYLIGSSSYQAKMKE